ncbi:MAG: hypothetical protein KKB30_10060 [Proteobacteria bacterium]|nr:hypothetical protein [Pseudomonadota bacterium]MBU1716394.1 hypothetical protein [Pseudomonadota bacterium]
MNCTFLWRKVRNEEGYVLVAALMFLSIVSVFGIFATNTTTVEQQIAINEKASSKDFYNQENCLSTAKMRYPDWLDEDMLGYAVNDPKQAYYPSENLTPDNDDNGNGIYDLTELRDPDTEEVLARFEVRSSEGSADGLKIDKLSDAANDYPPMNHIDIPPIGSGYSQRDFETRRFVVTCENPDDARDIILQEGVYKIFNKF